MFWLGTVTTPKEAVHRLSVSLVIQRAPDSLENPIGKPEFHQHLQKCTLWLWPNSTINLIWQALPKFYCCSGDCQSWAISAGCVSSLLLDWMTFIHSPFHSPFHSWSMNWIESWTGSKSCSDATLIISTPSCCFSLVTEHVPTLRHIPVRLERAKHGYKDCFETLAFLSLVRTCKLLGCRCRKCLNKEGVLWCNLGNIGERRGRAKKISYILVI